MIISFQDRLKILADTAPILPVAPTIITLPINLLFSFFTKPRVSTASLAAHRVEAADNELPVVTGIGLKRSIVTPASPTILV